MEDFLKSKTQLDSLSDCLVSLLKSLLEIASDSQRYPHHQVTKFINQYELTHYHQKINSYRPYFTHVLKRSVDLIVGRQLESVRISIDRTGIESIRSQSQMLSERAMTAGYYTL